MWVQSTTPVALGSPEATERSNTRSESVRRAKVSAVLSASPPQPVMLSTKGAASPQPRAEDAPERNVRRSKLPMGSTSLKEAPKVATGRGDGGGSSETL